MLRIKHTKCGKTLPYNIYKASGKVWFMLPEENFIDIAKLKNEEELLKYIIQGYRYSWCSALTGCGTVVEPPEWEIIDE